MILPNDHSRCTGHTEDGHQCHMKQNCKRYLAYTLNNKDNVWVTSAPDCIKATPLDCPLKIIANNEV
jgi:hypothetical protein